MDVNSILPRKLLDTPSERRTSILEDLPPRSPETLGQNNFRLNVVTLLIAVAVLVGGAVWVVHSELAKIDSRMNAFETSTAKRLAGLETAVRILSDTQSKPIVRNLVNHTLAVSEKALPSMKAPAMRIERKINSDPVKVAPNPRQRREK